MSGRPDPQADTRVAVRPGSAVARASTAVAQIPDAADLVPADYARPADVDETLSALGVLSLALGWKPSADRRAAVAALLVRRRFTVAQLALAVVDLSFDPDVTKALRFPDGTITPADFERVLNGDGDARHGRLYTHAEMLRRNGSKTAGYVPVRVEGRKDPMWREA